MKNLSIFEAQIEKHHAYKKKHVVEIKLYFFENRNIFYDNSLLLLHMVLVAFGCCPLHSIDD